MTIKIHKLIAKSQEKDAQTLLVIGSTKSTQLSIQVTLTYKGKAPKQISKPKHWIECAFKIDQSNNDGWLKKLTDECSKLGQDETFWIARFDFPDHGHQREHDDQREHGDLEECWKWFVSLPETEEAKFCVKASVGPTAGSDELCIKDFSYRDVEEIELFELGVLFIHGIGPHKVRETLTRFGEPIVEFWEKWLEQVTLHAAKDIPEKEKNEFCNTLMNGVLKRRQDNEALPFWLENFKKQNFKQPKNNSDPKNVKGIFCGGVRVEDTLFATSCSEKPSSTLLRFTLAGEDENNGNLIFNESHVLMSEAWWTEKTVYPDVTELTDWIWKVFPVILLMHIYFMLKSTWDDLKLMWDELNIKSLLLLVPMLASVVILLAKLLLWTPFLFVLAAMFQATLAPLGLLNRLPIRWLRRLTGWFIELLTGSIGQSYALKTSAIRSNAMVRAVMRDLEWMNKRCQRIVVISHSQGAEVARQLFQARRWPKVSCWITFGAGIVPLNMLQEKVLQVMPVKFFTVLLGGFTITTLAVFAIWPLSSINNWAFQSLSCLQTLIGNLGMEVWIGVYIFFMLVLKVLIEEFPISEKIKSIPNDSSSKGKDWWHNYFASHDPVSAGPMSSHFESNETNNNNDQKPNDKPIFNTRFAFLDHTTYFKNIEQFVAPVALDLFDLAGLEKVHEKCKEKLKTAAKSRGVCTLWRMVMRYAMTIIVVWLVYLAIDGQMGGLLNEIKCIWDSSKDWGSAIKAIWSSRLTPPILFAAAYFILVDVILFGSLHKRSKEKLIKNLAGVLLKDGQQ